MRLIKYAVDSDLEPRVGAIDGQSIVPVGRGATALSEILHAPDPSGLIRARLGTMGTSTPLDSARLLPPLDTQEVWGAGVTYERSKVARQEESEQGGSFYDLVYRAERPELFFKATPSRVVGHNQAIRVRGDTNWCVPEPELALVISPALKLVGFTIGNDVSARDIEGQNPLYLPQAKVYQGCCALGPAITLVHEMPPAAETEIRLEIDRDSQTIFDGSTSCARMVRSYQELIDWLARENCFPEGAILLTGTGIVPPDEFSLKSGDQVRMTISGIGTLSNTVVQSEPPPPIRRGGPSRAQ